MRNFTLFAFVILACVPNFVSAHPPSVVLPNARLWTTPRDPFPISRVFLSPQQHAELTLPPGQPPFVRLSREEFERRVRTAAMAIETSSPFISEARYVATYSEGSLAGTAEWTVVNPSRSSGTLRLDPLRIAISDAAWEKGTKAILSRSSTNGSDENSKTVVEVETAIPTSGTLLRCKWSARPTDDRGDRRFDLRFPSATIARIELSLPLALSPAVRRDRAILTGPFATNDSTTRRWSIALGGQESCELTIKTGAVTTVANPGPTKTNARWSHGDRGVEGTIVFETDPTHKIADEYVFELPHDLRIVDVVADSPVEWQTEATTLRVKPADAVTLSRISISVLANVPHSGVPWTVPTVRLIGSLPSEESIQLRLSPAVLLAAFDPGEFHVVESDTTDGGGRVLKLSGTFVEKDAPLRRKPILTFDSPRPQIAVTERATLDLNRDDLRMRVVATITALRGPVREFSLTIPTGTTLPQLPNVSSDPTAESTIRGTPPSEVTILLTRPLATGQTATVSFSLARTMAPPLAGSIRSSFPAVMWKRAERTGSIAVNPSAAFANASPFVVAYQDFPPSGEVALRLAERPVSGEPSSHDSTRPDPISMKEGLLLLPTHCDASIESSRIVVSFTGRTAPNANRQRLEIPMGMTVDCVRVSQRWFDRYRVADNVLTFDSGIAGDEYFEIRGSFARADRWIERFVLVGERDDGFVTQWSHDPDWLVWPASDGRSIWIVRRSFLVGFGWLIAGLMLIPLSAIFWGVRERRRTRWLFVASAAVSGTLSLIGFDAAAPVAVVALLGIVVGVWRKVPVGVAVALLTIYFPAGAAAPDPPTAYFVYGTGTDANRLFVLVPRELLDRLDRLATSAPPSAVLSRADYRGTELIDDARFEATWTIRISGTGSNRVSIPLSGTKVTSVTLDGQPAFPEPMPNGFTVSISGSGEHVVSATFTVPIRRISGERELRFSGPDVPEATLVFHSALGSRGVSVSSRRGQQTTTIDAMGPVTSAELGDGKTVAIRWRPKETPVPATVEPTNEVAVWDLGEGSAILNAGFLFPATRLGPRYRIAIPPGLNVVRVSARAIEGGGPISLDWALANEPGTTGTLTVTTRSLVEGSIALHVALAPDRLLSNRPLLSFPQAFERPDPAAVYAVRANGIVVDELVRTGAIDVLPEVAAKAAARFPEMNLESRPATRSVRRASDAMTISPTLSSNDILSLARHSLTWTIGRRSDLFAETTWDTPTPAFDSWELPTPLKPVSARGTDLIDWTTFGTRMTVWLRTGDEAALVRWMATLGESTIGERTLPMPRSPKSSPIPRVVRIRPATGWAARLIPATGITPVPNQPDTFTVDATVEAIRVMAESVEIPLAVVPTINPAIEPVATTPVIPPSEARAIAGSPPPTHATTQSILLWLTGFAIMCVFTRFGTQRFAPELIAGWGIIGWIALGPCFAIVAIAGLFYRIASFAK